MLNKNLLIKYLFAFLLIVPMAKVTVAQINSKDSNGLLADIPEPPNAKSELPSPVPMVYRFMGALMEGEFDVCLSNFDVQTFLELLYGKSGYSRLEKDEYNELFSYQIQTHRNEFRFLSKIMNRVAAGATIDYSDPRYNGKRRTQCKVVIRLDTNRGRFDYQVFCRFVRGRWYVYDYILNNQRLTQVFRDSIKGVTVSQYLDNLRPFYGPLKGTRPLRNREYEFSMMVPSQYEIHERISPSLLASVSALNGQFLLHVQAANYETPQTLAQVGKAIKDTLMPFNPRLYDQWKAEIAGVEIGNILFHFTQGNRILFCHMVLIPLGKKLVILNFYHSTLQIMKHMSNIRETIIRSLTLPRIEAAGGVMPGQFADEITLPSGNNEFGDASSLDLDDEVNFEDNSFNEDTTFENENSFSESENNPDETEEPMDSEENEESEESEESEIPSSFGSEDDDDDNLGWDSGNTNSTSDDDDEVELLRPDTYVEDEDGSGNSEGFSNNGDDTEISDDDEEIERPTSIPSSGGYGDGHFGDDDDYGFDDGEEVAF